MPFSQICLEALQNSRRQVQCRLTGAKTEKSLPVPLTNQTPNCCWRGEIYESKAIVLTDLEAPWHVSKVVQAFKTRAVQLSKEFNLSEGSSWQILLMEGEPQCAAAAQAH